MRHLDVGLVACGKSKLDGAAPAKDLYTGNLYSAASTYAEAKYDAWYILSARHGLLHPNQIVEPYDERMQDKTGDQLHHWCNRVDSHFRGWACGYGLWSHRGNSITVWLHAGVAYRAPLTAMWSGLSWRLEEPLAGLGIGEQLAWYGGGRRVVA